MFVFKVYTTDKKNRQHKKIEKCFYNVSTNNVYSKIIKWIVIKKIQSKKKKNWEIKLKKI